jgi:hypothetical protein
MEPAEEPVGSSEDALRTLQPAEKVGDLAFGETKSVAYAPAPTYRALRVQARAGDTIDAWVRGAAPLDATAWLVNARATTLVTSDDAGGTKDAHLVYAVRAAGEYWVVLRDKNAKPGTFTVTLAVPPPPPPPPPPPAPEVRSCKNVHFGGDTCGAGEVGEAGAHHESCCRSLEVPGYADPAQPGKKVYLDKYEITAGRVRKFVDSMTAEFGKPDIKSWIAAHPPAVWNPAWTELLPSDVDGQSTAKGNLGTNYAFGSALYVYVHGHNCFQGANSWGFPTYWYPADVMQNENGGLARAATKEQLDVKAMTCIPNAVLAAFCAWDGGQLATQAVLDNVTANGTRLAPLDPTKVNVSSDSASISQVYYYPAFGPTATHEGVSRIAAPGRVAADVVSLNGSEPWMDLRGNLNEVALVGPTGFTLLYQGIGYSSARAVNNPNALRLPEYKAGYSGGRCMRFK